MEQVGEPVLEQEKFQRLLRAEVEHRLKTSLSVIAGWATTLDDRWDQLDETRRREAVAIIRRTSVQLAEESNRLLEEARTEILPCDVEPVRLDLCAVLDVTTAEFDGVSAGHRVEHLTRGDSVNVLVDPAALQQVLGHLIENAVKYSPVGSQVSVLAAYDAVRCRAILEVRDEGEGVPEDVDLFAPFQRGPGHEDLPGVGLGLYIVHRLVASMGGDIEARRNPAGPGSIFTVRLPISV